MTEKLKKVNKVERGAESVAVEHTGTEAMAKDSRAPSVRQVVAKNSRGLSAQWIMSILGLIGVTALCWLVVILLAVGQRIEETRAMVSEEKAAVIEQKTEYQEKQVECSGGAAADIAAVNKAGVSYCGGEIAMASELEVRPLEDIYFRLCNMGFDKAVEGCMYPETGKIYVCKQGTSVYNRQVTGVTDYYIYYDIMSYSCDDMNNVIRHELLHVVYNDLDMLAQYNAVKKIESYRAQYTDELALYASHERDEELFVRVGADGRAVKDIELVDMYARVNEEYVAQKEAHYAARVAESDEYIEKYEDILEGYEQTSERLGLLVIINGVVLGGVIIILVVCVVRKIKPRKNTKKTPAAKKKAQKK